MQYTDLTRKEKRVAEAGGEIAECTHKHPLGFLPASLLSVLLYKVVPMSVKQVKEDKCIEHRNCPVALSLPLHGAISYYPLRGQNCRSDGEANQFPDTD